MAAKKRAKKQQPRKPRPLKEIKVGSKIVQVGSSRVWEVTRIDITGNGAKMLYLQSVADARVQFASWESDLRYYPGFTSQPWETYQAPRKPRAKKVKPMPTFVSRYDIMEDL